MENERAQLLAELLNEVPEHVSIVKERRGVQPDFNEPQMQSWLAELDKELEPWTKYTKEGYPQYVRPDGAKEPGPRFVPPPAFESILVWVITYDDEYGEFFEETLTVIGEHPDLVTALQQALKRFREAL
jgi:hypothetical protein